VIVSPLREVNPEGYLHTGAEGVDNNITIILTDKGWQFLDALGLSELKNYGVLPPKKAGPSP
jgi:hypothetical protein